MTPHHLRTITTMWRPLHPAEVFLFEASVDAGLAPRICTCGQIIVGRNDVDAYCRWKDHIKAAMKALADG